MKKVKVTLKPHSTGKKFYLFPDAESLYVWACAIESGENMHVPGIEELVLEPDGFIEAELRGFEHTFEDDGSFKRFNFIRLGKAQHPRNGTRGLLVTIHSGWVMGNMLPMRWHSDDDMVVRPIDEFEEDSKLDLAALFRDNEEPEDVRGL